MKKREVILIVDDEAMGEMDDETKGLAMGAVFLEEALDGETQREFITTIQQVSQQMLNLLNDLLDVSAIENGQLRSFLRQDPDVILIGEIRDLETAKIATEAALTGHLVLSSLHTNNALQAVTRLIEIGVEPFLVAPSLIGIMFQRLVRRICENCKESFAPAREVLDRLFHWDGKRDVLFYRGKGCPHGKNSGYAGRLAIHEMVTVSDAIRSLVMERGTSQQIVEAAQKVGYQSMRYDGIKKVLRGLTTLEEVNRVAPWA